MTPRLIIPRWRGGEVQLFLSTKVNPLVEVRKRVSAPANWDLVQFGHGTQEVSVQTALPWSIVSRPGRTVLKETLRSWLSNGNPVMLKFFFAKPSVRLIP